MLNFLGTTFRSEESLCRTVSGSQYIGSFSMLVGLLVLVDTTRCSIYLLGEEASPSIGNTVAHFSDFHASGYNSAGSERIWMKFAKLLVYCLELALTEVWAQKRER